MEFGFLKFILFSSLAVSSSHSDNKGIPFWQVQPRGTIAITGWNDVVVAREGMATTLVCTDTTVRGSVNINWKVKSRASDKWKLVLSASEKSSFFGNAAKESMRQTDFNFQKGVFSLVFSPKMEDGGFYSCLIEQDSKNVKKKIILLAILTVTVIPAPTIPQLSTLQLIVSVNPDFAITEVAWEAPDGISMKSEKLPNGSTVAKLPLFQRNDGGTYVCTVHPGGNGTPFVFSVNVTVDDRRSPVNDVKHGLMIQNATEAQKSFYLTCADVQGDFVRLYWKPPDTKTNANMKILLQYDRWRGSIIEQGKSVQLAGLPYNAETGNFSFLLTPELKDGGLYVCEVFLNDKNFSQRTKLSVLKVLTKSSSSELELSCLYSEKSQVKSITWKHQNKSLKMSSSYPGRIFTSLPLPITSDTAGNYTCTLKLENGWTFGATRAVTLPPKENDPSLLLSLSALLLLVPLVAAAVGVLLWRQKHVSDRGEVENIYENPEDIRQAPSQGSVYMDLKPRGDDDVYKELERYEQCQS